MKTWTVEEAIARAFDGIHKHNSEYTFHEVTNGSQLQLSLAIGDKDAGCLSIELDRPERKSAVISNVQVQDDSAISVLFYGAIRVARTRGISTLVGKDKRLKALCGFKALKGDVLGQRVDLAVDTLLPKLSPVQRPSAESWVAEIRQTALLGIEKAMGSTFFRAIESRTLSKEQYLYALSNMHGFVRWTTRLVGRIVSVTNDEDVRNEWLGHLQEEINHEKILEKDIEFLGEDPRYVTDRFVVNSSTRAFMAAQEALVGFTGDPILFAAAPIAAEGIAAHWTSDLVENLHACAASWGLEHPTRVSKFIVSHAGFDGGPDGHWEQTLSMVANKILNEQHLQEFMTNLRVCLESLTAAYASYVDDVASLAS